VNGDGTEVLYLQEHVRNAYFHCCIDSVNGMRVRCCREKIRQQQHIWRVSGTAPRNYSSQSTAAFLTMKAMVSQAMVWEEGEPGCGGSLLWGQPSTAALNRPSVQP
jgi:hypothetical protein